MHLRLRACRLATAKKYLEPHKKKCIQCIYRGVAGNALVCDYLLIMGSRRPCRACECTVYVKGKQLPEIKRLAGLEFKE